MEKLKRTRPIWKKSMLVSLNLDKIDEALDEISDAGDYYGYESSSRGEYYEEYRELFDELAMGATDLREAIDKIGEWDDDAWLGWDDMTVALLGDTHKVLGYDALEQDYYGMMEWDEEFAQEEAVKRLERLTKRQLIKLFKRTLACLVSYLDIKAAYDTLNAVVTELDDRAAIMQNGKESQRMYIE